MIIALDRVFISPHIYLTNPPHCPLPRKESGKTVLDWLQNRNKCSILASVPFGVNSQFSLNMLAPSAAAAGTTNGEKYNNKEKYLYPSARICIEKLR
jgi:hypothetical protein